MQHETGGDSAPQCGNTEGVAEEAVEEADPKGLTASHEGVTIREP